MTAEIIALRLIHILGGIFWVGSGLFTSLFLIPALTRAGSAAGPIMAALQQRRLFVVLPVVALVTILSGFRLMWIASAGFAAEYFASTTGRTFAISGAAAIIAFLLSVLIARPAAVRSADLAGKIGSSADGPARAAHAADLQSLQRRSATASILAVVLLVISAAGMAIARSLP